MCELTYVHTGDVRRNRMILYALMYTDSSKHKDGTGFSQGDMVWKSSFQACNITNLLSLVYKNVKTNEPIIGHTRFATIGAGIGKEICEANSHPFISERYILAHNGTLAPKVVLTADQKKELGNMTDSEYFLTCLQKAKKTAFIEAFNETMTEFTGKFAMLIHDRTDGHNYAVRGFSAPLHCIPITTFVDGVEIPAGFVINTEKEDLIKGLVLAKNLCFQYPFSFDYTKVFELDKETIYLLDGAEPTKVGTVKENFLVAAQAASVQTWSNGGRTYGVTEGVTTRIYPGKKYIDFCFQYGLASWDADMLVLSFLGKNIAGLSPVEITWLDNVLTPELLKRADKKKQDAWAQLQSLYTDEELYCSGISFPYFLEELPALTRVINQATDHFRKDKKHAKA